MNESTRPVRRLSEIASGIDGARIIGEDVEVTGLFQDTRKAVPGGLFVALPGRTVDGHDFAAKAVESGAAALLVSRPLDLPVPQILVSDPVRALGRAAAQFWGRPAERMTGIAVTGTNGKTTVCALLESILRAAGANPGVIGTVSYRYGDVTVPAPYTTPTPDLLHETLVRMEEAGCTHYVMEVSSHALEMGRVEGVTFQVAGFTNLTQDHLDLHGTMDAYRAAKQRLFSEHLAKDGVAVVWGDDPNALAMASVFPGRRLVVSAGTDSGADVRLLSVTETLSGIQAEVDTPMGRLSLQTLLIGRTNLANVLVASAIALALGLEPDAVERGIASCARVPGRLDPVVPVTAGRTTVLVDYAHTPDAIAKVLETLRPLTKGRLIIVFGCGGDRDRTKRPLMGRAAALGADLVVVTSDNPRTEDPLVIIEMAKEGVEATGLQEIEAAELGAAERGFVVQPDRRMAIDLAIRAAGPDDVVLIAGKGHEDYQILGTTKIHFDDREEALAVLERLGAQEQGQ